MKRFEINESNVLCHELIGLKAKVVESTDPGRIGLQGKIVDETMNLLSVETSAGEKKLPKKEIVLKVFLPNKKTVLLECNRILFRPEDRIKQLFGKKLAKKEGQLF